MNTDVGELLKRVKIIRDPITVGGIIFLIVAMLLFATAVTSLVRATTELKNTETEYETTLGTIEQIRKMQAQSPESLRKRVQEAQAQLQKLLANFPTTEEATSELARYYEYASQYNTRLVRMEAILPEPKEGEKKPSVYKEERFSLQIHGNVPNLMRFLAHIANSPYDTFVLDNISIGPDSPALAEASLTIFYSILTPTPSAAAPTATPTPGAGQ